MLKHSVKACVIANFSQICESISHAVTMVSNIKFTAGHFDVIMVHFTLLVCEIYSLIAPVFP